jgi:two-component system phosphate regulon sensor histidine kinase PhoR
MNIIWARSIASLLLQALLAALVAVLTGSIRLGLGFAVVLLCANTLFNTFHTQRLWRLLEAPVYGEVPDAPGIWGEIYYRLHKLAKRWHAQVRQVEQQHSRFIQAMQASPYGVVMLDDTNQIEWCNALAELHFGLDARRDVRQQITHLVRQPQFVRYLGARQYEEALRMQGMGGKRQYVLALQVVPYGDHRKLLLTQDITELERIDAMRRDFVANVSHELKTPLTVLSGFLETMRDLPLADDERGRYLDIMHQQAGRMQYIVNDLLALAKLEGDTRPPQDTVVDMPAVLKHLSADLNVLSGGAHRLDFNADESLSVLGAETEIMSALGNLVSNAVRYTPAGGKISVSWRLEDGSAVFSVHDTGIGIPADHIPRLTERFYRVDGSRSRDTGGTGLGLAIVKHVLQRHEAQLQVKSEEGRGSVFSVRFPAHRTLRQPAPALAS